jgi:hypothetical protein
VRATTQEFSMKYIVGDDLYVSIDHDGEILNLHIGGVIVQVVAREGELIFRELWPKSPHGTEDSIQSMVTSASSYSKYLKSK